MKRSTLLSLCLVASVAAAQESKPTVADLGWISGCWRTAGEDSMSFMSERWTEPLNVVLGTNRTVRNGSVTAYEFLRIEERAGEIYYVAKPSGATGETDFKLTALEGASATFENPDHDFPKKLTYSVSPEEGLTARVEGDDGGFTLDFHKVDCDQ